MTFALSKQVALNVMLNGMKSPRFGLPLSTANILTIHVIAVVMLLTVVGLKRKLEEIRIKQELIGDLNI